MELDNHSTKQTYIQLLAETLKKKLKVLEEIIELTEQQETIINAEEFKEDGFLEVISKKEEKIALLIRIDNGFDQLYNSVREELVEGRSNYISEINCLKELITKMTDLNVKLQVMEQRNRSKLELVFARKRKEIKTSRMNNQSATNYYKTMAKQHETQSYFYDKKN